jgi:hypothetical protein
VNNSNLFFHSPVKAVVQAVCDVLTAQYTPAPDDTNFECYTKPLDIKGDGSVWVCALEPGYVQYLTVAQQATVVTSAQLVSL